MRPTLMPAGRWIWLLLAVSALPAAAQETVVPKRNVRTGWAQVLRVDPVYQTLTATAMEEQCEGEEAEAERRGISRIVGAVKDALTRDEPPPAEPRPGCRMVPVERQFRRPIAYDVDYVYRGQKYRSRLPYDPGNKLRVEVTIQPSGQDDGD
ncbi:MAG TPA: hypothetical protein VFK18_05420 [Luteimonas sp.]|nr:hypothetical protein [Luteimonas sp.]